MAAAPLAELDKKETGGATIWVSDFIGKPLERFKGQAYTQMVAPRFIISFQRISAIPFAKPFFQYIGFPVD